MKNEIYKLIRVDKVLRRKIADALDVEPETIYRQAINKSKNLEKPLVKEFISKQLGIPLNEME